MRKTISNAGALVILLLILMACNQQSSSDLAQHLPRTEGMNVLVVSFDALRADALGSYGNARGLTPNLDQYAKKSVVFENAYTAAPVTPTSFAAAFTGQWPFRVFHGWKLVVSKTLAEILNENGYHTFGILNNPQVANERFFGRGFDHYETRYWKDDEVLKLAKDYLNDSLSKPFYGWVHFLSPHSPYDYQAMAEHLYDPNYEGPYKESSGQPFTADNPADLKRLKDLYDGEVLYLDTLFADLMKELDSLGLSDNTIVIITADHGEEFMEHGQVEHNAVFEELIRIPMIVHHPKGSGWRSPEAYSNVDLMPTLLSILDVEHELPLDGRDLTMQHDEERLLFSVGMSHSIKRHFSATQESDKLIVDCLPQYTESLFDLAQDPEEQSNLLTANPNRVTGLLESATVEAKDDPCRAIQNAIANQNPTANLTEEQIENLRSLGYIQ